MARQPQPPSCASSATTSWSTKLREAKEELFNLRFQAATGQLENHGRLRAVRADIARIYTVMRERELGIVRTARCRMSEKATSVTASREQRGLPQDPRGPGRQRQDGQDRRRRGRGPRQAPAVRQGHPPYQQAQGARRGQRLPASATGSCSWRPGRCRATKRWRVVEILEKAK